jgi:hypothetical protein
MTCLRLSPLNPIKGKITTNKSRAKLAPNAPLRGLGVNKYDHKL